MNDTQRKAITDLRLKGCSYSQISIKVGLSENTIKTFCRRNNLKAEDIASAIGPKEGVCECCGKPTVLIEGKKPNPDKPEKILQFLHISSTIKKNVGGCVHVTYR